MKNKSEQINVVLNEQNLTAYGDYYPPEDGNYGSTDTSYPAEVAYFDIDMIIWHKSWGGNIIDIDVTDLLDEAAHYRIQEAFLKTK